MVRRAKTRSWRNCRSRRNTATPEDTPANSPYNVAQLYARLANSIRNGTAASPGFDAAVKRHRLIYAIVRASTTGQKQLFD